MATEKSYRERAGKMSALARAETDPGRRAQLERIAQSFGRLAQHAARASFLAGKVPRLAV
jgi:hypothetical protein